MAGILPTRMRYTYSAYWTVHTDSMLVACTFVLGCIAVQEPEAAPAPLRVACVGDSITFGSGLERRERHSYPVLLGDLLGGAVEVRNFGVGGTTLLRAADRPYVDTAAYRDLLAWRPQTVVVILGTNDSCDTRAAPELEAA